MARVEVGLNHVGPYRIPLPWRRKWQPTPVFLGFPGGSGGEESVATQQGPAVPDTGSVSPAEGASSQEPESQPDLALARSLPPAEEQPMELPKTTGGGHRGRVWGGQ